MNLTIQRMKNEDNARRLDIMHQCWKANFQNMFTEYAIDSVFKTMKEREKITF